MELTSAFIEIRDMCDFDLFPNYNYFQDFISIRF